MSVVTDIRRALRAELADVPGTVKVHAGPSNYADGNGLDALGFTVRIHFGPPTDEAEEQLDELVAPTGVKQLLEQDRTLGGLVVDLTVTRCSGAQLFEVPSGEPVLGAEWTVRTQT